MTPALREAIEAIPDPEIPTLTIVDLGVLRSIEQDGDQVVVMITPTYSGCPAMDHIERNIADAIEQLGFCADVRTVFTPAWTTEWMTEDGRRKLAEAGIAPPCGARAEGSADAPIQLRPTVRCPRCGSRATQLISEFGSTACKALYRCNECLEPFDHFKDI